MKKTCVLVVITCFMVTFMVTTKAQNNSNETTDTKAGNVSLPNGYGDLSWGSYFSDARDKIKGTIMHHDENNRIVTREGEIKYIYGYFYPDPEVVSGKTESDDTEKTEKETPARLYYVMIRFPYVFMEDVKKKMVDKYGQPQGESMRDNQGAYIWESDQTTVIMWVDSYNDRPYCRKITYMSKVIARDINEYRKVLFTSKEREILRKLSP
ncbi:MAG: hypothetical protein ACOCWZ_01705 [Spirochaetota bacterium]